MPRGRRDLQLRLRPGLVQVPGIAHRADHVVAAVRDDAGDALEPVRVAQQSPFGFFGSPNWNNRW